MTTARGAARRAFSCARLLALGLLVAALDAPRAAADGESPVGADFFRACDLRVAGRIQTAATQDVDGDGLLDLLVLHIDDVNARPRRYLSVFRQKPGAGFDALPDQTFVPDPAAAALAFLHLGWEKGLAVACYRADGVAYYAWTDSGYDLTPRRLLFLPTFFARPQADALPVFQYPLDLDRNGLDDLLVPQLDGYRVCFQHAGGKFGRIAALELPGSRSVSRGMGNYLVADFGLPRLETHDLDGDWRTDLVACAKDRLLYWSQDPSGAFPSKPSGGYTLDFLTKTAQRDRISASFVTLTDVSGDHALDLVVAQTSGDVGLFESLVTKILLFVGKPGSAIGDTPDQILNLKGVSIDPQFVDVNGDGRLDLVVSSFRTDLLGAAKTALLKAVNISYYIFLYDTEHGRFSDESDYERMVSISTDLLEKGGRTLPHIYFNGNFDGDRWNDMASVSGEGRLAVYRGREGVGLFNSSGIAFEKDEWFRAEVEPPKGLEVRDFNRDGRADLLLRYGGRLRVYVSRTP